MIRHKLAITLGLIVVLTLGGAGASYAFWSAPASAGGSVAAKTINVTETMPVSFGGTLTSSTPIAGAITITNSGTVAGTYGSSVATSGSSALAAAVNVVAWTTTNPTAANCITPTGTTASGTWANPPALTGSLAPGSAVSYCIKSSLGPAGGLATSTISLTLTATLTAGTSWSASAAVSAQQSYTAPPPPTVTWYQLKNVATGLCASASATSGASVVVDTCDTTPGLNSQAFKVSLSGTSTIIVYLNPAIGISNPGNSGNRKTIVTAATTNDDASWIVTPQSATSGPATTYYTFTNVGNSLGLYSTASNLAQTAPSPSTQNQQFILVPIQ